ncbi:helix-turn-helix domain-containing protein [Streptomyces sp. NPDC004539]|uniref:winged helix-turn-helix transcriptional regulator n=1 Tax=Streptomyces sp. NPDC004539 TaxID=3154280 RepID=UPI0033B733BD
MESTDKKVSILSVQGIHDPHCGIEGVERALAALEGRWKLKIIFHLMREQPRRFSSLERAIPGVTQKMLIQQLRALERDGIVLRTAFPELPPHVEYQLTVEGAALIPAMTALAEWADSHDRSSAERLKARD